MGEKDSVNPFEFSIFDNLSQFLGQVPSDSDSAVSKIALVPGLYIFGRGNNSVDEEYIDPRYTFIPVEEKDVSRVHAKLEVTRFNKVTLTDLESSNGTKVNREKITGPVEVSVGDAIQLGESRKFCIVLQNSLLYLWSGKV